MSITLPLFRDGDKLTERHLYELAFFALGCARWAALAGTGFFAPPPGAVAKKEDRWNGVDPAPEGVRVRPLFLLHGGYPLIKPEPTPVPGSGECLYARLRVARGSAGLAHDDPGYEVDFAWDGARPGDTYAAVVELARRGGTAGAWTYELVPPSVAPGAVPELAEAAAKLRDAAEDFRGQLVRHAARNPLDRDLLMERLERLAAVPDSAPTASLLTELRLAARAARGFFLRLRYGERPAAWAGAPDRFRGLTGAVLEFALEQGAKDPALVGLPVALKGPEPAPTAHAEVLAVQQFAGSIEEGGDLWRLLADTTVPVSGTFNAVAGSTGRRYDCLRLPAVKVEVTGEYRANVTYGLSDETAAPANLRRLDLTTTKDGKRTARVAVTARYLFLSAPNNVTVTVSPEGA